MVDMKKTIYWEVILILASVLIFRSAWNLLDKLMGTESIGLWITLLIGISAAVISLYIMGKK